MASLITHLILTKELKDKYNFSSDFLLGGLLPDVYKLSGKVTRRQSHFIKIRYPQINKFLEKKNFLNDKQLGYLMHLVQDKVWYTFQKKYIKISDDEYVDLIYSDMNIFDKLLMEKYAFGVNDFEREKQVIVDQVSTQDALENLSQEQIKDVIRKNLRIREITKNEAYFLNDKFLDKYLKKVIIECEKVLNSVKFKKYF